PGRTTTARLSVNFLLDGRIDHQAGGRHRMTSILPMGVPAGFRNRPVASPSDFTGAPPTAGPGAVLPGNARGRDPDRSTGGFSAERESVPAQITSVFAQGVPATWPPTTRLQR
ncbi:hypothetical protein J7S33_28955, partial [Saccharothrix algeriensis]